MKPPFLLALVLSFMCVACHKPEYGKVASVSKSYWLFDADSVIAGHSSWDTTASGLQELQFAPDGNYFERPLISFSFTGRPVPGVYKVVHNPVANDQLGIRSSKGIDGPYETWINETKTVTVSVSQGKVTLTGEKILATMGGNPAFDSTRVSFDLTEF